MKDHLKKPICEVYFDQFEVIDHSSLSVQTFALLMTRGQQLCCCGSSVHPVSFQNDPSELFREQREAEPPTHPW